MSPAVPLLLIGREGMSDEDAKDFDSWVAFVSERIEKRCGFTFYVLAHAPGDVQRTEVRQAEDDKADAIREALSDLWDEWCYPDDKVHP